MINVGVAFLICWILIEVFAVTLAHSLLAVAIIFIVLGLVMGERPLNR